MITTIMIVNNLNRIGKIGNRENIMKILNKIKIKPKGKI